jgi:hypothetical protein
MLVLVTFQRKNTLSTLDLFLAQPIYTRLMFNTAILFPGTKRQLELTSQLKIGLPTTDMMFD